MRFQIIYLFTLLWLTPILMHAQQQAERYVWNRKGVATYAAPALKSPQDTLPYGMKVHILEVGEEIHDSPLFTYQTDTDSIVYNPASKWLLIEFGDGQRGYIPDTYLLTIPPNMTVVMPDYFSNISPIEKEEHEGQTEQFCMRSTYSYKNGIQYMYSDLGPCESCGQSITQISLPVWTLQEAFVFITNFDDELWDMDGTAIDNYLEQIESITALQNNPMQFQWSLLYDLVTLKETENGVEIFIDTVL